MITYFYPLVDLPDFKFFQLFAKSLISKNIVNMIWPFEFFLEIQRWNGFPSLFLPSKPVIKTFNSNFFKFVYNI